ncbi:MAG: tRNA (adenosine(37)-N6)-threonylcarbamoyltransferase complex ATPase subunit type 1 TsaE [Sphingomonadales bacterium]
MPDHLECDAKGSGQQVSLVLELPDETATATLAQTLASVTRTGDVIALRGDLGAGKTTFARHFIHALGCGEEVPSPTFTLVQVYSFGNAMENAGQSRAPVTSVWHFDLYRIAAPEEVFELGIEDAFEEGVSLIEWPDKMASLLPEDILNLDLEFRGDTGARGARLSAGISWTSRLAALKQTRTP